LEFPYNICTMAEARDFKCRIHSLGLPRPLIKSHPQKKVDVAPWARELRKFLWFPCNISATAEASNFKIGMHLGFAKAHDKTTPRGKSGRGLGLGKLLNIWGSLLIFLQRLCYPLSISRASYITGTQNTSRRLTLILSF